MHVLYLHQYFATPGSAAGTRSYELARRLVARGHRVTMVTGSSALPEDLARRRRTVVDGIDVVVVPVAYGNEMSYLRRLLAFAQFALRSSWHAWRSSRGVDVVFATSTPLTIVVPGVIASRLRRVPLVFEVRDLWPSLPIAMGALPGRAAQRIARLMERFAYRSSAQIVALSPGMADGVRAVTPSVPVTVIPNACDIEMFAGGDADRGQELLCGDVLSGKKVVVYAGTLGAINGVDYLVELAARTTARPDVVFVVAGRGAQRRHVQSRASAAGVLGRTFFLCDPVAKREMPHVLRRADVCTSLFLPLPEMEANSANKFFDALAAGRPLAINYGGWQADLLEETGAGVALPRDPEGAAEMLLAMLDDPAAQRRREAASRALAARAFDRDDLALRLERVLLDAVASGGRGRGAPEPALPAEAPHRRKA